MKLYYISYCVFNVLILFSNLDNIHMQNCFQNISEFINYSILSLHAISFM